MKWSANMVNLDSATRHTHIDGPDTSPASGVKDTLQGLVFFLPRGAKVQVVVLREHDQVVLQVETLIFRLIRHASQQERKG
jgi:hypothetical protein